MDLITVATAASELDVAADDARLVRIVAAIQADFVRKTGRTFDLAERSVYCRGFGQNVDFIYLPEAPIVSVSEIRIDCSGALGQDTAVDDIAAEFWWDTNDHGFQLHRRNGWFPEGSRVAMVRFEGGYEESVPADLSDGIYDEVFARYRRGTDEQFASASIPGTDSFSRFAPGHTDAYKRAVRNYRRPV
jgi:hypothetical protein